MQMNEQGSKNRASITPIIRSVNKYSEVTMLKKRVFKAKQTSCLFSNNNIWNV